MNVPAGKAPLPVVAPPRTILIMAGGTGGHIYPALAVAEALSAKGWHIVWLGTESGMESRLVPQKGYPMETIRFSGVRGKGLKRWVMMPAQLLIAFAQSIAVLMRVRPDVVLGMGGFAAFPGGLMAVLLAKPLVIHEQNSVAGLTNRLLARLADRVLTGFPNPFGGKIKHTLVGNPVRADIAALVPPEQRFVGRTGRLRLLVVGGSLGAMALNETLPLALALLPENERPEVLHQSGAKQLESLRANYEKAGVKADTRAYIDDMAQMYAWCDLVVCRAGALTLSEIAAAGVASVLVPYPHAVDDHQTHNARFLSENSAAVLLPQSELNAEKLADLLKNLSREILLTMAQTARKSAKPDATQDVARACGELASGNRKVNGLQPE